MADFEHEANAWLLSVECGHHGPREPARVVLLVNEDLARQLFRHRDGLRVMVERPSTGSMSAQQWAARCQEIAEENART